MIFQSFEDEYFIILEKDYNEQTFLKRAKLKKNSFAWNLMRRIYRCLTSEVVNVIYEYKRYYAREYDTFEKFLYKKYNLDSEFIETLLGNLTGKNLLYFRKKYVSGDYAIEQLIFSDEMKQKIIKLIKK